MTNMVVGHGVVLGGLERAVGAGDRRSALRRGLIALLTALLLCGVALPLGARLVDGGRGVDVGGAPRAHADVMPSAALAEAASGSIGRIDSRFWPARRGGALRAEGDEIASSFGTARVRVRVPAGTLTLSRLAVGRDGRLARVAAVAPTSAGDLVRYRAGSIGASYGTGPYGIEQSFTLARRPRGATGALTLALTLGGSLVPKRDDGQILFQAPGRKVALRYGQLRVLDAAGRQLPASIELRGRLLELRIEDRGARYPLRVDPFIQQEPKLLGDTTLTGGEDEHDEQGQFASSIAISADGNTALIGTPEVSGANRPGPAPGRFAGGAFVFTRSGSTWSQDGPMLVAPDGEESYEWGLFGEAVALSANGYTAVIGAPGDNNKVGAVWVFTRTGSTWTQQGRKLTGSGTAGEAFFGNAVAVSSDGSTALVGGPFDGHEAGAAWVFVRSGSTWAQQGEKLTAAGEVGDGRFGGSVVLSGDGDTAVIGAPGNAGAGAAWVFTHSGTSWTQGEALHGGSFGESGEGTKDTEFGYRVALSTDGHTALIGSHLAIPGQHDIVLQAGWVFVDGGSGWSQQGPALVGVDEDGAGGFAASVALSGDGDTALIGDRNDHNNRGEVTVFTRAGTTWTQSGAKLFPATGAVRGTNYGAQVALSAWGTALVGSGAALNSRGAAWAYGRRELGCTDSWTDGAGGNWLTGEDWSRGVPPGPEDEACIQAPGTYTVTLPGGGSTVKVRSLQIGGTSGAQTLQVAGTCSSEAALEATYGTVTGTHGSLVLTGSECAGEGSLAGPLDNHGSLHVEAGPGAQRLLAGDLLNDGTVALAAGVGLRVTGGYQQTPQGRLKTAIAGASDYGSLAVYQGVSLAGTLAVEQVPPFEGALKQSFAIIDGARWLIGAFEHETGDQIGFFPAEYYKVGYSTHYAPLQVHRVTLDVTPASVTLTPKAGPPGAGVTVSSGEFRDYEVGDTITPTFTDSKGALTVFPGMTVGAGGTFSTTIAIPTSAAIGAGTLSVSSAETGVKVDRTFTVE